MRDLIHGRPIRRRQPSAAAIDTESAAPASNRVDAIEGLRGYLALWVLVCHVLWVSGIENHMLSGLPKLLRNGYLAVDLFIIVSGFAIFMCLDTQPASYRQFVVRRFWRLFPLFIILFAVSIPLSHVLLWNVKHATQFIPLGEAVAADIQIWWDQIHWNIALHALMMHGVVPENLIADAPGAFLGPAWSVSLEWQFYLVAPLAIAMAVSTKSSNRLGLLAICLVLYLGARYALPTVRYGAALPFHVEYFVLGAASYFTYKHRSASQRPDVGFAIAIGLGLVLISMYRTSWNLIPIALWVAFMGVVLEPSTSMSSRLSAPLFANPVGRYLGRISYSIYLSHLLVIVVLQHALLVGAPQLSRAAHFSILLVSTTVVTVAASTLLYRFIEAPGIRFGRFLAQRRPAPGVTSASELNALPQRTPAINS